MKRFIPIIITCLVGVMLISYIMLLRTGVSTDNPFFLNAFLVVMIVFFVSGIVALVLNLRERLHEIDKEDDDDLSKY